MSDHYNFVVEGVMDGFGDDPDWEKFKRDIRRVCDERGLRVHIIVMKHNDLDDTGEISVTFSRQPKRTKAGAPSQLDRHPEACAMAADLASRKLKPHAIWRQLCDAKLWPYGDEGRYDSQADAKRVRLLAKNGRDKKLR